MRRFRALVCTLLVVASAGAICAADSADLPLGLPADQTVPTHIPGYRLVQLDRTKPVKFKFPDRDLVADVPIFIYLPDRDVAGEFHDSLKAIHATLARLVAQKQPVDPEQLTTLFLALDRVLAASELPVRQGDSAASPLTPPARGGSPGQAAETRNPFERAREDAHSPGN